jgi:drug/metabolite transporter (DMT)-like permease
MLAVWAYSFGTGLEGPALPLFALSGAIGIGMGDVASFQSLPRLGPRLSSLVVLCLTAPFGALIEWVWMGTKLSLWQAGWGAVILSGVVIALVPSGNMQRTAKEWAVGAGFAAVAAFGTACGAVLSRRAYALTEGYGFPIDSGTAAFQRVIGGILVAAIALLVVKRSTFGTRVNLADPELRIQMKKKWSAAGPWILANSLAGQTLGVSAMQLALQSTPTGVVLAIIAVSPIMVIPMAYFFEGERPSIHSLLGGLVAVGGVVALALRR